MWVRIPGYVLRKIGEKSLCFFAEVIKVVDGVVFKYPRMKEKVYFFRSGPYAMLFLPRSSSMVLEQVSYYPLQCKDVADQFVVVW